MCPVPSRSKSRSKSRRLIKPLRWSVYEWSRIRRHARQSAMKPSEFLRGLVLSNIQLAEQGFDKPAFTLDELATFITNRRKDGRPTTAKELDHGYEEKDFNVTGKETAARDK